MAIGAAHVVEELLAALHLGIVHVTGGRDSQATVPHHEVDIVLILHLWNFQVVGDLVVHHQVVVDVGLHITCEVVLREVVVEFSLHVGVLRSLGGISGGHVVTHLGAVRHIGDVPDGVGTGGILQRTTREGVGVLLGMGGVAIITRRGEVGAGPHGGIEAVRHKTVIVFLLILCSQRVIWDGIDQAGAVDADGRFETADEVAVGDGLTAHLEGRIESLFGDVDFRIGEVVGLAIGELVAPFVGVAQPVDLDLGLVQGSLEGCDGLGLRHASVRTQVGVVLVSKDEQIAIAPVVGAITVHAHAVAIAGMASDAAATDVKGSEAVERLVVLRIGALKEVLAVFEGGGQASLLNGGGGVFIGGLGGVEGGAQLTARIGLFADDLGDGVFGVTGGDGKGQ